MTNFKFVPHECEKCCICGKPATLLCDGDGCDRHICREHSKLLAFYRTCRSYGNWSVDLCSQCEKLQNHWRLKL